MQRQSNFEHNIRSSLVIVRTFGFGGISRVLLQWGLRIELSTSPLDDEDQTRQYEHELEHVEP